jgi:predicted nucleic acid-binding protein
MPSHIEPGTIVFVDANILLYAVYGHWKFGISSKCLLDSINDGKYNGITSVLVCNEVFHKSLIAEIVERENMSPVSVLKCLKDDPDLVRESTKAWAAIEKIKQINHLTIVGIDESTFELALRYSKNYALLSNDALHLATMKQEGVSTIASNDRDFSGVEWLQIWKP